MDLSSNTPSPLDCEVVEESQRTESSLITAHPGRMRRLRARIVLLVATPLVALAVLLFVVLPASGAAVIEYFNVISSSSAVLLEWSTASEYNVAGFEVLCKVANEPRSAYHRIGFFPAKGNPSQGAQYDMLVTALKPEVSYCFTLREITTDGEPGETRERCGYGLSITPTPVLPTITPTVGLTPTIILFPTPTFDPFLPQQSPLPTPTFDPFQPTPTFDPFATATPGATPLGAMPGDPSFAAASAQDQTVFEQARMATPDAAATALAGSIFPSPTPGGPAENFQPASPLPEPLGEAPGGDLLAAAAASSAPMDAGAVDASAVDAGAVDAGAVDAGAVDAGAVDAGAQAEVPAGAAPGDQGAPAGAVPAGEPGMTDAASADTAAANAVQAGADLAAAAPTPTSLYVVVTAATTPAGQGIPPAVTPWPTATSASALPLASLMQPTAQNLTVMLLCAIVLGAGGLGMLGLITSVLYFRSRSQRDLDELRWRRQRRL